MAITSTTSNTVGSKEHQIVAVNITAWAQNDILTITHGRDTANARNVTVLTTSTLVPDEFNTTDYLVTYATTTTTTVKALNASPVAVKVIVSVPTN